MVKILLLFLFLPSYLFFEVLTKEDCGDYCQCEEGLEDYKEIPVYYDSNSPEYKVYIKLLINDALDYAQTMSFNFPYLSVEEVKALQSIAEKHNVIVDGFNDSFEIIEDYDLSE